MPCFSSVGIKFSIRGIIALQTTIGFLDRIQLQQRCNKIAHVSRCVARDVGLIRVIVLESWGIKQKHYKTSKNHYKVRKES